MKKKLFFPTRLIFYWMDMSIKKIIGFGVRKIPIFPYQNLFIYIDLYLFNSTVTGNSYKELLETKFFPFAKKRGWVKTFHFMQGGATPHRTKEVFKAVYNVCGNRVNGLGYPKFAHRGIEWSPYSPDLNPCDFFLWRSTTTTTTTEELKAIRNTSNSISDETSSKVLCSFRKRIVARVVMVNTSKIFIIKFINFKKCLINVWKYN